MKNKRSAKQIKRNLPIVEFLIWIFFSVWAFKEFLALNQYFALALFIIMLVISILSVKIILKDFVAGIIIKSDSSIDLGDTVTTSKFSGIISKFNYRTLELELQNKSTVKIPYAKVLNNSFIKEKKSKIVSGHSFEMSVYKKGSIEKLIQSVKQEITLLPWASLKQRTDVQIVSEISNKYLLEITVFAYNKEMYFKIEKFIKEKFSA